MLDYSRVKAVYADGGVISRNPSPLGGTWAYCLVTEAGRLHGTSGVVTPADVGLPEVSNNVTEYLAVLLALESLPDRWAGDVYTDSGVTLLRFQFHATARTFGLPPAWVDRCRSVRRRLGVLRFTLLGGHPSKAELKAGVRRDGKPVSIHNVWCDEQCGQRAAEFRRSLQDTARATA